MVKAGRAVDLNVLHWDGPLALVFHVDALSVLFALMGQAWAHSCSSTPSATWPRQVRHTLYASMLIFIAGFVGLVYSANSSSFISAGTGRIVLLQPGGLLVHQPRAVAGARKVLLMTHIAGYGLLAASWSSTTARAARSGPTRAWRTLSPAEFCIDVGFAGCEIRAIPTAYLDSRSHGRATPVSALLHAACYVKAGVYLACRMHSFGAWPTNFGFAWGSESLVWVGTVTMAVA